MGLVTAAAQIQSLAWKSPYPMGVAIKKKNFILLNVTEPVLLFFSLKCSEESHTYIN